MAHTSKAFVKAWKSVFPSFISALMFNNDLSPKDSSSAMLLQTPCVMGSWLGFREWLQLFNHLRQKGLLDHPDNGVLDAKIIVDNAVSEPTNAVPVNFGKAVFKLSGKSICRFPDDFKISDHGIHCLAVLCKVLETLSGRVGKDLVGTLQYVTDQQCGLPLRHRRSPALLP